VQDEHASLLLLVSRVRFSPIVFSAYPNTFCRVMVAGAHHGAQWADVPLDVERIIMHDVPLAVLARLATLSKGFLALYRERLQERDDCIRGRLAQGWPAEVTEGLSPPDMAVPQDLVMRPPVRLSSLCLCKSCSETGSC
jgi:hypothetical protein